MRAIKVRAWSKSQQKYVWRSELIPLLYGIIKKEEIGDLILEQFSDHFGINNVEIYENDLVECAGSVYQIVYKNGAFGLTPYPLKNPMEASFLYIWMMDKNKIEVIGNINQNQFGVSDD
jgi:hypothetical protein